MKRNPGFTLNRLAGVPYLLPYGQMIADHRHGVKINETGVFFWQLLAVEHTLEEALEAGRDHFQIGAFDYPSFKEDITAFFNMLLAHGILLENTASKKPQATDVRWVSIAGLYLKLVNFNAAFPEEFTPFLTDDCLQAHQTITFHTKVPDYLGTEHILIHNAELHVLELEEHYLFRLPQSKDIFEVHITKDGSEVQFFGIPTLTQEFKYDLFHALRLPFLYLAQQHHMVALHSASLLYKGRAWLFSGSSGTGKSTHTNLWKELLQTPIINGDLNLLAFENKRAVIHGIPWCGTSGICNTQTYPLGGIVLLKQAPKDSIQNLPADEKILFISQRLISPSWTQKQFDKNMDFTTELIADILVCRLHCTKEHTAVETIKTTIDKYLEDA